MTAPWHARRLGISARTWLTAVTVVALGGWEPFRTTDPDVEAGNRAYAEGRYDDALAAYDRAARRGGVDADGLAFDRGTAELQKADAVKDLAEKRRLSERALEDLKQAGRAKDPHIRGGANYNRGNALMGQDRLDDAIEAYKQALREDPELDDARLNLELALRRREKQQKQQQQQGQGQGQQGQGQQGQGQQGQGQGSNQGSGAGSNQQGGSNDQGSNQQNGSNGDGSNQSGSNGGGSNQQNGSNGAGSDSDPQNGQGSGQGSNRQSDQNGQNGSGQNQSGQDQSGTPRGRSQRRSPQSPRTPTEGKLDDLDTQSRRLQKDEARRRATGKTSDPQHDW